ncbi:MAG TPA: VOC family protein [Anaeromyxobacter sp.]|nr:VOC family protein [Anaeromyxobacter sp.]
MDTSRPPSLGLRHAALRVRDLAAAEAFFTGPLGYRVAWRPDPDNVYLVGDGDNVALHRGPPGPEGGAPCPGLLDHLGIRVPHAEDVDAWERHLEAAGAHIHARPRTHRDGSRSLYVEGPEGILVQVIHW